MAEENPMRRRRSRAALATAIAQRDRLQRSHDALLRLIDQHAATKDELAANDLELTKAQSEVTRLTAAKQEFDRGVQSGRESGAAAGAAIAK